MPRLTEKTRRDRREQIAEAAMSCFARQGFAATSMADIIEESGLSAGSIYSHFSGKADLMRFASTTKLQSVFAALLGDLDTPPAVVPPRALLRHLLTGAVDQVAQHGLLAQIWIESARDEELSVIVRENMARIHDRLQAVLLPWAEHHGAAHAAEHAGGMADAVMAVMQGFMVRLTVDPSLDAGTLASRLCAAFDALE
ncbi:MAG: TetR/AcrR family transcriptional regulator [Actinobacteria bacterium]|nr:TetR/AcrR family transcriptional regulator [Actinomycetota bacterium]